MPVRFTCQHCDSTLSVSSRKAGLQVTCPKCRARTLVPGATDPKAGEPAATEPEGVAEEPDVVPPAPLGDRLDVTFAATEPPLVESPAPVAASEFDSEDEVIWVYEREQPAADVIYPDSVIDYDKIALPRHVLYGQGVLLAAIAMVSLVLGILIGRSSAPRATEVRGAAKVCYLTGTVTYANRSGTHVPDDGAVLIVVPQDERPPEKASVEGLRPGDPEPGRESPALSRIKGIGGDYVRADEQGGFKLRVPDTGEYFILVVSNNADRRATEQPDTVHLAQMGRYFMPATDLIGQWRYQWLAEQIKRDREFKFVLE